MNDLAIINTSAMQGFRQLQEINRLKYPDAYLQCQSGEVTFDLGEYLVNYCFDLEPSNNGSTPDWIFSFIDKPCALTPEMKVGEYYGFFGLPSKVQEGILIYIHEEFYKPWGHLCDFSKFYNDLMMAAEDVVREITFRSDQVSHIKDPDELDNAIDDELMMWLEGFDYNYSYSGHSTPFFNTDEEITLFCQLAAYMGHELYLYPESWSDMELAPADVLLEAMAAWEKKKQVLMVFRGKEFDHTDTVITINASQSVLTGNTELAEYMEKIFNQSPWHYWLKEVMENFREYFPLRKEKIRVDAYAQIESKG